MTCLILNFFLYLLYTLFSIKKSKVFTIHNLIALWFTFVSFMGVLTVYLGIYGQVFGYDAKFPKTENDTVTCKFESDTWTDVSPTIGCNNFMIAINDKTKGNRSE